MHQFFSERMILSSRNVDVDEVNEIMLNQFSGEVQESRSADCVVNDSPEDDAQRELMYPVKYLNGINCSGLPLSNLRLKIRCPVLILINLNPAERVCNGTRGIVTRMSNRVIEISD